MPTHNHCHNHQFIRILHAQFFATRIIASRLLTRYHESAIKCWPFVFCTFTQSNIATSLRCAVAGGREIMDHPRQKINYAI